MAGTSEHVIFPSNNRNSQIPVRNRFDGIKFDPLNMSENDEPTISEEEEDNEVDFGVQKVYQGFKYWHDPSHVVSSTSPATTGPTDRHPSPPLEIVPPPPQPPLVHDLSPPTSPLLVENGFRNFLVMIMNWATAGPVVFFLGIGCCAFLLLQR